ncbi:PDZ domain-containing protein [Burkholderiaceae bacterium DAT-1]|nr:PDZ domain-containing protein [Burkholderiaceae bacterium DAT-1]
MNTIKYRIEATRPEAHLFTVSLTVDSPDPQGQAFSLPVWIPGSYLIREFAKNIVSIRAHSAGRDVTLNKVDKNRWEAAAVQGALTLEYTVYAFDLSVRHAYLDDQRGFFNGTSVFLAVEGQSHLPCDVEIAPPKGAQFADWRVATSLQTAGAPAYGFGHYSAADYDELIDHPVELGAFTLLQFEACGVPHDFVLAGRFRHLDEARLLHDCKAICETQIRMFGEPAPFDRYVFMTVVTPDGYGGLEHRASTALVVTRDDLPRLGETTQKDGYRKYLGLISHEYFHSWNVKRIKPAAFAPYAHDRESLTRLLWVFEGITSYYDDLLLLRAGVIHTDSYLELLGQTISGVISQPGRLVQTLAESSFDTWIKYYRQDENSPNSGISYYTKGALAGLCLDLHIRNETHGKHSLDDVMLALWQRYGRDFHEGAKRGQGIGEDEFESIAEDVTGLNLRTFFDLAVRSTQDLPLQSLLASAGIDWQQRAPSHGGDKGKWLDSIPVAPAWLGWRTSQDAAGAKVSHVLEGSPAQAAGISAGDLIIAVDGLRVTHTSLEGHVSQFKAGDTVTLAGFRRDELRTWLVTLADAPHTLVALKQSDRAKENADSVWPAV